MYEIVDQNGPLFQMKITSPSSITIYGIFPLDGISHSTGRPLFIWCSPGTGVLESSTRPEDFDLKPMFKYPFEKYPHVFAD